MPPIGPKFWRRLDDEPRVKDCKERDRLIADWSESIAQLSLSVAHLTSIVGDRARFRRRFQVAEQAQKNVTNLRSALELHRDTHGR
jgi:hypothetical protein